MAKKTKAAGTAGKKRAVTATGDTKTLGRGRKLCPQCSSVVGARTQICECGHTFRRKRKKGKRPAAAPAAAPVAVSNGGFGAAMKFVASVGGLKKAQSQLNLLEQIKSQL